jgi:hypothetical protein
VSGQRRPLVLDLLSCIVALQACGLAVLAVATVVEAARGDRSSTAAALLLAAIAAIWAAGLAVAVRGLLHGRRASRAPVVMTEFLLVGVGIPLAQGNERVLGIAVLVTAAVGLVVSLTRSVTTSLAR